MTRWVACVAGDRAAGDLDDRAGLQRFAGVDGWLRVVVGADFSGGTGHYSKRVLGRIWSR